ncbi:MAG TPA: ABC transporter permease [Bryobacteraceae bacterium]|nr:ABC transporter permease [Bryobacteraceae bacterium]
MVTLGLRLYRALASAFPYEFKNAYGEELIKTTEDAIEEIWRSHGVFGLLRLLLDIALRIPAEYIAEMRQDVHYGLRMLAGSPGFTGVALVSLCLGICIATCAYSELNGMLRDLPGVSRPGELVSIQTPASYPAYQRYGELHDVFSATFAYVAPVPFGVSTGGRAERTWGHLVTPSYFSALGVRPALGRFFGRAEEQPGCAPVVVVGYRFWQERLGSDPAMLGKPLRVNGVPATIIGVAPKDFLGASPALFAADIWLPVAADPRLAPELAGNALARRDLTIFHVTGRLQPGKTEAAAEAELNAVTQQMQQAYGEADRERKGTRVVLLSGGKVIPIRKQDMPFFREFLLVMGGMVLLIACANVANMMLARAAGRRREIAVRLALGAGRARLIRQLLTESMLLAAGSAVLAFPLCAWCMHLMSQLRMPFPIPMRLDLNPDWRALLFTLGLTVITGVAFGLAPALQATRADLLPALKEGGQLQMRKFRRISLRNALVLCQMATSLTLLLLTGYMGLGIQSTLGVQEGFNPRNLYLVSLDPVRDGYSTGRAVDFLQKLLDRVQRLPSVAAACLTDTLPVAVDGNAGVSFSTAEQRVEWARKHVVGHGYFETAGIRVLAGRGFRREDEKDGSRSIVVSEQLVRVCFRGQQALGRQIELSNSESSGNYGAWPGTFDNRASMIGAARQVYEIVGVVNDVTEDIVASKKHPAIYFPQHPADYAQPSLRGVTLMLRAKPGADAIAGVRQEISALDPNITPFNARSMAEHIAEFMSALKGASWTYGLLGIFGLVLASVGLAGVTAYSVAQRGHEIGIRLALGAQRRDVLGLVMREGAALVFSGALIGLAFAWAGMRSLGDMFAWVASVKGADPVLLGGAPLLLISLALAACYVPARKSTRVDPMVTLRQE